MSVKRDQDGEAAKWPLGIWLACIAQALLMIFASQFDYKTAMMVLRLLNLLILIGCFCFWRRSQGRPVFRSFIFGLGVFGVFVIGMLLIPTGVTEWG